MDKTTIDIIEKAVRELQAKFDNGIQPLLQSCLWLTDNQVILQGSIAMVSPSYFERLIDNFDEAIKEEKVITYLEPVFPIQPDPLLVNFNWN